MTFDIPNFYVFEADREKRRIVRQVSNAGWKVEWVYLCEEILKIMKLIKYEIHFWLGIWCSVKKNTQKTNWNRGNNLIIEIPVIFELNEIFY